jgi:hypothetical protein
MRSDRLPDREKGDPAYLEIPPLFRPYVGLRPFLIHSFLVFQMCCASGVCHVFFFRFLAGAGGGLCLLYPGGEVAGVS